MRRGTEIALALLGAAGVIVAALLAPWLKFVLTIALAKGIAVLGILLLLRAGQVSFGHALFLATGAYTVAFFAPRLPEALLLLPLAAVLSTALGLVVGLFVVACGRTRSRSRITSVMEAGRSFGDFATIRANTSSSPPGTSGRAARSTLGGWTR